MGVNHDMGLFLFVLNSYTLLSAELSDKQLIKCTFFKKLIPPPQTGLK
jgi:hypothetical protein